MDKIIKIFKAEIKSIDLDKKRAVVVVSTDKKDGDGDIIVPDSFKKRLKRYKDHPILLSSHNYYDLRKQIGMSHSIKLNDKDVECDFEWFSDAGNEEADWGWFLAQKGIAAFSIGFQGIAYDWIEEKDEQGNKRITGRKFTEIELLEISQVLVPSNAGALQNSINDSSIPVEAKEMAEFVLKGMKDGKIIYEKIVDRKTKKDDTMNNDHENRLCAIEKCMGEIKSAHADLGARLTAIEASINTEVDSDPDDPKNKKPHYTKKLLGDGGNDHKHTPLSKDKVDAEILAIKQAFK